MKIPSHIKKIWINALRNKHYKQGKGSLESHGKYCCLGVLQKELDGDVERYDDNSSMGTPSKKWCESHKLPYPFWKNADSVHTEYNLTDLNDFYDYSFEQIAEVIEHNM